MKRFSKFTPPVKPEPQTKDADGNVILDITVRDDSDFLSPFSSSASPVISEEVADFLKARIDCTASTDTLCLRIHSDCITPEEETVYRKAIKTYYAEQYHVNRRILRRNAILALILLLMGIATLTAVIVVDTLFPNTIWAEVVDIVAWVFLWEAADLHFLENRAQRIHQKRLLALYHAKLEFDHVTKDA